MSISEKANYLLNKFGRAQFDFVFWSTRDNLVARDKACQQISDYIEELEAAQRWIPVSERLPEEGHKVLVLLTDGAISIDLIYGNDFLYENWVGDITHWMPLPKLPEVQDV